MKEELKKEFEEYKMELILLSGDIICTSERGSSPMTGEGEGGDGGEGWDNEGE